MLRQKDYVPATSYALSAKALNCSISTAVFMQLFSILTAASSKSSFRKDL